MNIQLKWKDEILPFFDEAVSKIILNEPTSVLSNATEIRISSTGVVSITVKNINKIMKNSDEKPLQISLEEREKIFNKICQGTIYKYENQIKNGYITVSGGHRVGFCGTAVYDKGKIQTVKNITAITFRISRQIKNAAREIIGNILNEDKINSALIISEPGGGKTTILSDLTRLLSNSGKRLAVIDERGELCSVFKGVPAKEIGELTYVFDGYSKGDGMMMALRCMSPQVIICDEIGTTKDIDAMLDAMNAGVPVIASAHALDEDELLSRPQIERLIDYGAIDKLIFLKGSCFPGAVKKVITVNRYDENCWNSDYNN